MSDDPSEVQATLRVAYNLLESGQYDQVDALLYAAELASNQINDMVAATTVAATRQIFSAYRQCHTEIEWHNQAREAAERREQQLRQNAYLLLGLISGQGIVAALEPVSAPAPETIASQQYFRRLWLYLRSLLQFVQNLFVAAQTIPTPSTPTLEKPVASEPDQLAPDHPEEKVEEKVEELMLTSQAPIAETEIGTTLVPPAPIQRVQALYTLVSYYFGPFRVYQHDQLLEDWNGLRGQAILKYLLARRGTPIAKDILMDVFWPDADPESARRNLHQAIYSLRQTLRRGDPNVQYIQFENNQYMLNPELSVWVDFEEFETYIQTGRRLATAGQLIEAMAAYSRAEGLYQGNFLAEDVYEDWPRLPRDQLRNLYMEIADRLSEYYVQQAEYAAAIVLCQKILALDNCFEEAHRRLMLCYLAQGQRHLAIRQYQTCVQALADELDVPPSEEIKTLYAQITANL